MKITNLSPQNELLETTLREKEQELGLIKQRHSDDMSHLMDEMRQLRENYNEKIHEYEGLLDLRIQLEQEIATLSALLQEEEIRYTLHCLISIMHCYPRIGCIFIQEVMK